MKMSVSNCLKREHLDNEVSFLRLCRFRVQHSENILA
jgi:hypothetical protein